MHPIRHEIQIRYARIPQDLDLVRTLFSEYTEQLAVDLGFQSIAQELAELPGKYAQPQGRLLIGWQADRALGCVALRSLKHMGLDVADGTCEMKRMYVRPDARGTGLGRALALRIVDEAKAAGYRFMVLDTLARLAPAVALYQSLGFEPVAPYIHNPLEGVMFLGKTL